MSSITAYLIATVEVVDPEALAARINRFARHGWHVEHVVPGIGLFFRTIANTLAELLESLAPLCATAEEFHSRLSTMLPPEWESDYNDQKGAWLRLPSTASRSRHPVSTPAVSWEGDVPDPLSLKYFLAEVRRIEDGIAAGEIRHDADQEA